MKAESIISKLVEGATPTEVSGWSNILAAAYGLYTLAYTFHWKAKGPTYYSDHELFSRLYQATAEEIDEIAEKAIGTTDDDTFINATELLSEASEFCNQYEMHHGDGMNVEFVEALLNAEREYVRLLTVIKNKFEANNSLTDGVEDFLQALCSKHEGHIYLLQQRRR